MRKTNKNATTAMLPMMCCCTKCCCNCGMKFGDPRPPAAKKQMKMMSTQQASYPPAQQASPYQSNEIPKKLQTQSKSTNNKERIQRLCMQSGGVELVPLLARRRAMQRPISLSTTDVTKCPNANK